MRAAIAFKLWILVLVLVIGGWICYWVSSMLNQAGMLYGDNEIVIETEEGEVHLLPATVTVKGE